MLPQEFEREQRYRLLNTSDRGMLYVWLVLNESNAKQDFYRNSIHSSPPGQNGHIFADDIFRCIFMNEKFSILAKISLRSVPKGPIHKKLTFV